MRRSSGAFGGKTGTEECTVPRRVRGVAAAVECAISGSTVLCGVMAPDAIAALRLVTDLCAENEAGNEALGLIVAALGARAVQGLRHPRRAAAGAAPAR